MALMQLVYASRPFGYDDLTLSGILNAARLNNKQNAVTGCLICREDLFLQMLEGSQAAVLETFERIKRDDRHTEIVTLICEDLDARLFPDWAMKHDPARSWMWTAAEVSDGAVAKGQREVSLAGGFAGRIGEIDVLESLGHALRSDYHFAAATDNAFREELLCA